MTSGRASVCIAGNTQIVKKRSGRYSKNRNPNDRKDEKLVGGGSTDDDDDGRDGLLLCRMRSYTRSSSS